MEIDILFLAVFFLGGSDKRVLYIDVMSGKIMKKYQAHAGTYIL
jgi:hypothetical protein